MAERSRTRSDRPAKPYPDFPLFPHATRRWAKKIRGRFAFFGPWDDPQGALARYLAQRDHLFAGVTPPASSRRAKLLGLNENGASVLLKVQAHQDVTTKPNNALRRLKKLERGEHRAEALKELKEICKNKPSEWIDEIRKIFEG